VRPWWASDEIPPLAWWCGDAARVVNNGSKFLKLERVLMLSTTARDNETIECAAAFSFLF
jgi:hypothetical protein